MADEDQLNWNVDLEVSLFHAFTFIDQSSLWNGRLLLPEYTTGILEMVCSSGINRNFQMIFLHDKLNNAIDKKVSTKNIWSHLRKMYDLSALNDSDGIPFPNKECDFSLPEDVEDELVNKVFPRYTKSVDGKVTETESNKESISISDTPASKEAVETKAAVSTSRAKAATNSQSSVDAAPKHDALLKVVESTVDSPKPDPRKRTRQSLQSPQTDAASTPSSAKRVRRI